MKLLITGGGGYMGRNLARLFRACGRYEVVAPTRKELDVCDWVAVRRVIRDFNPDRVLHAAVQGGTVADKDTLLEAKANIDMYNVLLSVVPEEIPIFIIGSGAEFDRSRDIDKAHQKDIESSFPVDPYGLSKNIITRRAIHEDYNSHVLRLFGCFCYDEEPFRFIKSCVLKIKEGKPIEINQDRMFDFFYMDDAFRMFDFYMNSDSIEYGLKVHMNLVYLEKYFLSDVAEMIVESAGKEDYPIFIRQPSMGLSYTGDGTFLDFVCRKCNIQLIGLQEGIRRTCEVLL